MTTWDANMKPENVLCLHPKSYPYFETDVLPGTDWEIEQLYEHTFYAYRWDQEEHQMVYIKWPNGNDAIFETRDAALEAIRQAQEVTQ